MMSKTYTRPQGWQYWQSAARWLSAPHTLIAGTTGAGKSTVLNAVMWSLLGLYLPSQARYMLIDPKGTELRKFCGLSDYCAGYAVNARDAERILDRAITEMESRNRIAASKDPSGFNCDYNGPELYIIIDELADLMTEDNAREIKRKLQKLLQLGRSARVHVIAATQAPNRKIIPAELTLNFTNRVALRCVSAIESRQIVNVAGAERLPEHGRAIELSPKGLNTDLPLLFLPQDALKERCDYWRAHG